MSKTNARKKIQNLNAVSAAKEDFIPVMRELVKAFQAFSDCSAKHVRELGLTPSQFDVIATLGNRSGMCMSELAERTLVTKGTLTGIVDRLEKKGLVAREIPPNNRRSFVIVLTAEGTKAFESIFPSHIAYLKQHFDLLSPKELKEAKKILERLKNLF